MTEPAWIKPGTVLFTHASTSSELDCSSQERRREIEEGPIRGVELLQRGLLVLHGSCVALGRHALAICGPSGAGKSTLAAYLCLRGATLVSDGMAPVHPGSLEVIPGAQRFKLNDGSLGLLDRNPLDYPLVHPESKKRYFPVPGAAAGSGRSAPDVDTTAVLERRAGDGLLRLELVLIVEDAERTEMVPIRGANALMDLLKNVYLVNYLPSEHSSTLMRRATEILHRGVQVKALRRKKEPGRLIEIAESIEREAHLLERGSSVTEG